jgi:hypothetical protein
MPLRFAITQKYLMGRPSVTGMWSIVCFSFTFASYPGLDIGVADLHLTGYFDCMTV